MVILGLCGGIASGKSHVAALLAERGAVVCDADRHARAALDDPSVRRALVERWGEAVLAADGSLDRRAIAKRVFGGDRSAAEDRKFLEGLVHPIVRHHLRDDLDRAEQGGAPAAVLDVPLLFEACWAEECDHVLFVDTPAAIRRERAAGRGWSPGDLDAREAAQMPIKEKRSRADRTVAGDDAEAAAAAVKRVWAELIGGPSGG